MTVLAEPGSCSALCCEGIRGFFRGADGKDVGWNGHGVRIDLTVYLHANLASSLLLWEQTDPRV